jgi:hypothetical protein
MRQLLSIFISILAFSTAWAGQVEIQHQFQAGTTAVAAQVNANFQAVKTAVDDNALQIDTNSQAIGDNTQQIDTNTQGVNDNAQAIVGLQAGLGTAGISVKLDGVHVGRFVRQGRPIVEVAANGGTELVAAGGIGLGNTPVMEVVSDTGYLFTIVTSDHVVGTRQFVEGELDVSPVFYDDSTCTGNAYRPVAGNTGFFTSFQPGTSDIRPFNPWALRQGMVWASPDPADANPVYMVRRGQAVQTVPLLSLLIYAEQTDQALCVNVSNLPGFDINNPAHVNNTAFAVEPADADETGIADRLGGAITVGL